MGVTDNIKKRTAQLSGARQSKQAKHAATEDGDDDIAAGAHDLIHQLQQQIRQLQQQKADAERQLQQHRRHNEQ